MVQPLWNTFLLALHVRDTCDALPRHSVAVERVHNTVRVARAPAPRSLRAREAVRGVAIDSSSVDGVAIDGLERPVLDAACTQRAGDDRDRSRASHGIPETMASASARAKPVG